MKKIIVLLILISPLLTFAAVPFEGSAVPNSVYLLPCDGNPRIVIAFGSGTPNVWYPASISTGGTFFKEFLSIALTAKASSSPLFFYGADNISTPYCIGAGNARQIYMIGVQ